MFVQEKARRPRNTELFIDIMHIAIGIVIVVLSVISFLEPQDHMLLFPIIFFLAAILNLVHGSSRFRQSLRERKGKLSGAGMIIFGICLTALSVISAVSIWWG